jgi:hypothetical protein
MGLEIRMNMHSSINTKRRITGNVLITLGCLLLIGSAVAKVAHVPKVVTELEAMGFFGHRLMAIAVLEMISAILFLILSTRSFGLLMISAYLGGAIATHIGHGSSPVQPGVVLISLWLGAWLRHPEILWSFDISSRPAVTVR